MKNLDVKMMHPAEQIAIIISRIYLRKMTTTSSSLHFYYTQHTLPTISSG